MFFMVIVMKCMKIKRFKEEFLSIGFILYVTDLIYISIREISSANSVNYTENNNFLWFSVRSTNFDAMMRNSIKR